MTSIEDLLRLKQRYGNVLDNNIDTLTDCQIQALSHPSLFRNKGVSVEKIDGGKQQILWVKDTYTGNNKDNTSYVYGIMRAIDYKVVTKDFNPASELGSNTAYTFTLKDKSKLKVRFYSEITQ